MRTQVEDDEVTRLLREHDRVVQRLAALGVDVRARDAAIEREHDGTMLIRRVQRVREARATR